MGSMEDFGKKAVVLIKSRCFFACLSGVGCYVCKEFDEYAEQVTAEHKVKEGRA